MDNLSKMIIGVIASSILRVTNIYEALLIIGIICTGVVIILAIYSKSRLGLKPEEYKKEDIEFEVLT